jgi:hypothetical protein
MSAQAHTEERHLRLLSPAQAPPPTGIERLTIPSSPRLDRFLQAAAQAGLSAPEAVRLGVERALVVRDTQLVDLDVESARRMLRRAAAAARPSRPLCDEAAAYVRGLSARRPVQAPPEQEALEVELPPNLLTRAHGTVPEIALHDGIVEEMIGWERAARMEGRSMSEWALKVLAARRAA